MTRQFPSEIYVGQTVLLYIEPVSAPLASRVTHLDYATGRVHVQPIGYGRQFAAHPRAICDDEGHELHFENDAFYFEN